MEFRKNAVAEFVTIFRNVTEICKEFEIDINTPCTAGKQRQRCNVMNNNPEEYYRISILIPFLDSVSNQIHDRLLKHKTILESFMCLLPNKLGYGITQENGAKTLLQKYERLVNCGTEIIGEIKL